jgi:hypothetical protein
MYYKDMKDTHKQTGKSKRKPMPPQRLLLIGALLVAPWFVLVYVFDTRDVLAALLALIGYVMIFIAAGKIVAAWLKQRRASKTDDAQ